MQPRAPGSRPSRSAGRWPAGPRIGIDDGAAACARQVDGRAVGGRQREVGPCHPDQTTRRAIVERNRKVGGQIERIMQDGAHDGHACSVGVLRFRRLLVPRLAGRVARVAGSLAPRACSAYSRVALSALSRSAWAAASSLACAASSRRAPLPRRLDLAGRLGDLAGGRARVARPLTACRDAQPRGGGSFAALLARNFSSAAFLASVAVLLRSRYPDPEPRHRLRPYCCDRGNDLLPACWLGS